MNKQEKIQRVEIKCLKAIIGAKRINKQRNKNIRKLGIKSAIQILNERKLCWYERIVRTGDERQVKKVYRTKPTEKGKRGRLKKKWNGPTVKINKKGVNWNSIKQLLLDRKSK